MPDTTFIAYVYPGWHASSWRPGLDEWSLLDAFEPYFPGHLPPTRPTSGRYDDSSIDVATLQIGQAQEAGLAGFTYFMYPGSAGFVLADPFDSALAAASTGDFGIGATWCLRLPHQTLPLSLPEVAQGMEPPVTVGDRTKAHPVRLGDLAYLFDDLDLTELSFDETSAT